MKKYSYVTLLSSDSFIFGIILLSASLKQVGAEYPLEVLVTNNVSNAIINILNQMEVKYQIIEPIKNDEINNYNSKIHIPFARNWALTLSKFRIFSLMDYDKIIFLDADIMLLKNIDHLFECPHLTCALDGEYFNIWPNNPHFNAGLMVVEPKEGETNKLIEFANEAIKTWTKQQCIADQEILNLYYSDWKNKPELHLNKYYNIFGPYIQEEQLEDIKENAYFIHFTGRKPWREFSKQANETYSEYYYEIAHALIQTQANLLDWDKAKKELKLAIYGICKDEIVNIEKYLQCFSKADYICLLDTGSTDGTWEYLQKAKETYPNLIIDQKTITPWRYDEARNISLELVPKDTTIYFMMDLDEIIKDDNWVELIKNAWHPLFSRGSYTYNRQVDPNTGAIIQQFTEYRIHNKEWYYKGIVHEQLCNIGTARIFFKDENIIVPITVWHYSTNPNREIYIELCERGVKEEPLNWLMHLQLAAEYEVHGRYEQAITEYRKILAEQNNLSVPELGRCYSSLGRILLITEQETEGEAVLKKGISLIPDYGDFYFLLGEYYYKKNNYKSAFEMCNEGVKYKTSFWCTIVNYDSYLPYLIMGLSQYFMGNKVVGLGYLTIAKEKNSNKEISDIYISMINEIVTKG